MYIKELEINNIRSITQFKMSFEEPAGWHVLIGDNGAGKSSIIRSIALALVGPNEILGIKPNWSNWLQWQEKEGSIKLALERKNGVDVQGDAAGVTSNFNAHLKWLRVEPNYVILDEKVSAASKAKNTLWGGKNGWFSAGYGPFRRFTGGSYEMEKVFENPGYSRLASHLSLFGEDVALTEATKWLVNLRFQTLEASVSHNLLDDLIKLINSPDFLPHNARLDKVSSEGVTFTDGNGAEISVTEMSDGYRSILSLTFELLRQLIRVYGHGEVFQHVRKDKMFIDLPGVVLIDEVDVHLHPTWQTRIGQWFLKYFPNIQFIVTTHSPLVCRASDKGSIWRLAAPGSESPSGEITGDDKNRLIYGNVLDAYGTDVFGESVTISKEANDLRKRMGELNIKSILGQKIDEEELKNLKQIFPTEKPKTKDD